MKQIAWSKNLMFKGSAVESYSPQLPTASLTLPHVVLPCLAAVRPTGPCITCTPTIDHHWACKTPHPQCCCAIAVVHMPRRLYMPCKMSYKVHHVHTCPACRALSTLCLKHPNTFTSLQPLQLCVGAKQNFTLRSDKANMQDTKESQHPAELDAPSSTC